MADPKVRASEDKAAYASSVAATKSNVAIDSVMKTVAEGNKQHSIKIKGNK